MQLSSYDWLADYRDSQERNAYVEVQFKNTRKLVFTNPLGLELHKDDLVAVEGNPGMDVGVVVLTGTLAALRFKRQEAYSKDAPRQVFRLATEGDLERWHEAKNREHGTMIEARQIADRMGLDMKIGDVEYQADGSKAIFYYIADGRVDFRQLIRVLADTFHVRIEMKQIGARQEAGRIGGIGPCGRPLCCAQWMLSFKSVNTSAARVQDIPLNPEKLTGMCAKLKCCMNFEVHTYAEKQKQLPPRDIPLETQEGVYYFLKSELLKDEVLYSKDPNRMVEVETISTERAFAILQLNRQSEKPLSLKEESKEPIRTSSKDILDENLLTRFDNRGRKKRPSRRTNTESTKRGEQTFNRSGSRNNERRASRSQNEQNATSSEFASHTEQRRETSPAATHRPNSGRRGEGRFKSEAAARNAIAQQKRNESNNKREE